LKFLLNMNLPRELGRRLATCGHTWRHVGDIGLAAAADEQIVAEARQTREVILTHDLDYGAILAFSGEDAPSVITFRTVNTLPDHLLTRLNAVLPDIETALAQGAIVSLEDAAARVRRLPIG
jgi:predicted nuclease of predicted toxin-antitoxin system